MGVCASSHSHSNSHSHSHTHSESATTGKTTRPNGARASESFRRSSSIIVMDMVGGIKEYKEAIPASVVLSENPNCYLCNSETMYIGTCMPRLPHEEDLLPGRIYFLVPLSRSDFPLSLPLLCDLAVKASCALPNPNISYVNTNRVSLHRRSI